MVDLFNGLPYIRVNVVTEAGSAMLWLGVVHTDKAFWQIKKLYNSRSLEIIPADPGED